MRKIGKVIFKDVSAEVLHPDAEKKGVYHYVPVELDWDKKEIVFKGEYNGHWETSVRESGGGYYLRGEWVETQTPLTREVERVWVEDDCIYPPENFEMPDELKAGFVHDDATPLRFDTAAVGAETSDKTVLVSPSGEIKYYFSYSRNLWRPASKMKSLLRLEYGRGPNRADRSEELLARAREQGLNIVV